MVWKNRCTILIGLFLCSCVCVSLCVCGSVCVSVSKNDVDDGQNIKHWHACRLYECVCVASLLSLPLAHSRYILPYIHLAIVIDSLPLHCLSLVMILHLISVWLACQFQVSRWAGQDCVGPVMLAPIFLVWSSRQPSRWSLLDRLSCRPIGYSLTSCASLSLSLCVCDYDET